MNESKKIIEETRQSNELMRLFQEIHTYFSSFLDIYLKLQDKVMYNIEEQIKDLCHRYENKIL